MSIYSIIYILTTSAFLVISGLIYWNGCDKKVGNILSVVSLILASVGLLLMFIFK